MGNPVKNLQIQRILETSKAASQLCFIFSTMNKPPTDVQGIDAYHDDSSYSSAASASALHDVIRE
jgi:hypothetical protein